MELSFRGMSAKAFLKSQSLSGQFSSKSEDIEKRSRLVPVRPPNTTDQKLNLTESFWLLFTSRKKGTR